MNAVLVGAIVVVMVILFVIVNRRPVNRTPDEVAATLRALREGTLDSKEWDFFVSVHIRNPDLEKIRLRCTNMWVKDSPFLKPGAIDPSALSEIGMKQVQELLIECEKLSQ